MIAKDKRPRHSDRGQSLVALATCVALGLTAQVSRAATQLFDVNGATLGSGVVTGGTYSWEDPNWTASATGITATTNWVEGNFPKFVANADASGKTYTVTVSGEHTIAGIQNSTGGNITISGGGTLDVASGLQGVFISNSSQNLTINCVVGGPGELQTTTSGSLFLYGHNTYSGGTNFNSSAGVNFNNTDSFGTGALSWTVNFIVLADPNATAPITINNAITGYATAAASTVLVTGAQPTTFSSNWALVPGVNQTFNIGNGAFPNAVAGFSGNLTGSGSGILKTGTGVLVLSGTANSFNGDTTVTAGTLRLGAANTIASSPNLHMNGGNLDSGSFIHTMTSTVLFVDASSKITLPSGGEIDFANSQGDWGTPGTRVLNVVGEFSGGLLRFGTDSNGLISDQLANIEFDGNAGSLGSAWLTDGGYLVPEPSSALLFLGAPLLLRRRKRLA